ncbi:MAG: SRPBCC domain-containing protein [Acidimicrobiia bacterium]
MNDTYAVTVRREIAAPAEDLFDAWLDAESLGAWMKPGDTRETSAETDPRVGGAFRIVMETDEHSMVHSGTYQEIDRPHRLVFTWNSAATEFRDSIVTVTFEPSAESTLVEIHQVGLPDEGAQSGHHAGWSGALAELDRLNSQHDPRSKQ